MSKRIHVQMLACASVHVLCACAFLRILKCARPRMLTCSCVACASVRVHMRSYAQVCAGACVTSTRTHKRAATHKRAHPRSPTRPHPLARAHQHSHTRTHTHACTKTGARDSTHARPHSHAHTRTLALTRAHNACITCAWLRICTRARMCACAFLRVHLCTCERMRA